MDMLSKKNSTPDEKGVEKKPLYEHCIFIKKGATRRQCHMITCNPENNQTCKEASCKCRWRYCSACVRDGTISDSSQINSPDTSLCTTHIDRGEDFVIGSYEKEIHQPTREVGKGKKGMRINRLAIIEAVVKKRNKLNK